MATRNPAVPSAEHEHDAHGSHPGDRTYIRIAIILSIITAVEVLIYYIDALEGILVPALIILSLAKFLIVIEYFMHLKFDDRNLTYIFMCGLGLALATFVVLSIIMHYDKIETFVSNAI